jgi:uncharacterized protein
MPTQLLIPTFTNQLTALTGWLDKAEAHALAITTSPTTSSSSASPSTCFRSARSSASPPSSQEAVYRLRQQEVPPEPLAIRTRGATRPDEPGTLADCRALLAQAIASLKTVGSDELDPAADSPLSHALPMGMVFDMAGFAYVRDSALPQVTFRVDMAYALLRCAGVPLGKKDYVSHMWAYLRPGTMPGE